jgi:hypothetical protein
MGTAPYELKLREKAVKITKAMKDENLQTMIPLGIMDRLDKYKQQQSEAEAAALAAPAPVADAPATTAGFKEWFNRF